MAGLGWLLCMALVAGLHPKDPLAHHSLLDAVQLELVNTWLEDLLRVNVVSPHLCMFFLSKSVLFIYIILHSTTDHHLICAWTLVTAFCVKKQSSNIYILFAGLSELTKHVYHVSYASCFPFSFLLKISISRLQTRTLVFQVIIRACFFLYQSSAVGGSKQQRDVSRHRNWAVASSGWCDKGFYHSQIILSFGWATRPPLV